MGSIDLDPFDYVYSNIPNSTHILKHAANYEHCKAKKFQYETADFSCRNGEIELAEPEPIPELMRLWSSADADSRHFRESIRFFNGNFAFTTLGVSLDNNYTNMKSGVYTFRAHGTMYHKVHSFGPRSRPEHLHFRSTRTPYRGRIHTRFIDGEMMVVRLRSIVKCWITDGSCLTTLICCGCSTAT
ncbi:unnamed protein product [Triticum turgidum subsp. durum]|uniref:Uncharacterized protein n=1 Tax=Triticum turgidum subsp. durum TaxID=4567 RepID=A0A9R0YGI1_TRITD|nr:unnamed protein product [Triticum turgidum subsp. durum]